MLPEKIELEIVTPDRLVLHESVDEVVLPGSEGYLGVLPGHAPLLTALAPGELSFKVQGREQKFLVGGGFAEVLRDRVSVLATSCKKPDESETNRRPEA